MSLNIDAGNDQIDNYSAIHAGEFDLAGSLAAIEHVFYLDYLLRFAHTVLKSG